MGRGPAIRLVRSPAPCCLGVALVAASLVTGCHPADRGRADHVFVNGAVYTADAEHGWAEAVAIEGPVITFVGDNRSAGVYIGEQTTVHDLEGRMLLPGFHDTHAHVLSAGGSLNDCDLQAAESIDVIEKLLRECALEREYGPDDWVIGGRWELLAFADGSPRRKLLDEIFGGRPAYFVDSFGHTAWVSSRALEIAGIDSTTPDPPQGVIERDPVSGTPSGTLREDAMSLVSRHLPAASPEKLMRNLETGLAEAVRFGITAYIEPGLDAQDAEVYAEADRAGRLRARVLGALTPAGLAAARFGEEVFELVARREELRGTYFHPDAVKVYLDGVIETRTSYMLEPYLNGENFPSFYPLAELIDLFPKLDAAGLQIHTHAIGDAAIRLALDAYAATIEANGRSDNRHQIVHLQLIDEADIPRFGELGVAAGFQGLWVYPDDYIDLAVPIVGESRVERFYPVASVERAGGLLAGGSDWDVSSLDPLDAIETLVRRQDPWAGPGRVLGVGEEVSLETALDMYTRNAAWVMRLDEMTGSIEPGKRADLVVLDRNLFAIPVTEINEAAVLLTMMDGRVVYEAE
jgi:predicted amidohydrolase YtcJ